MSQSFRGNKAKLPQKACITCGLTMTWRRKWQNTWSEVKHCSEKCRRNRAL